MKPGPTLPVKAKEEIYREIDEILKNPNSGGAALDAYRDDLPGYNQWKQKQFGVAKTNGTPILFSSQLPRPSDIPASAALSPGKFQQLKETSVQKAAEREAAKENNDKKRCCNLL